VALVGAGLLLMSRARAQRTAVVGVSGRKTADYFNPVDVAGALGSFVANMTKGLQTSAPAGIFAVKSNAQVPGSPESGLAGWTTYTGSVGQGTVTDTGDPYNAWSAPYDSSLSVPSATRYGTQTDEVVAGPLYDTRFDFVNNPLSWMGVPMAISFDGR